MTNLQTTTLDRQNESPTWSDFANEHTTNEREVETFQAEVLAELGDDLMVCDNAGEAVHAFRLAWERIEARRLSVMER